MTKQIETCFICKLGIDLDTDDFVKISDYHKGKHFKSIYCHPNCWREHMNSKQMLQQAMFKANQLMQKVGM